MAGPAKENSNKVKLLKLWEILQQETDEEQPISRRALLDRMTKEGFTIDIRTLSRDIATLNEFGWEVMMEKTDHENLYYVTERTFNVPEIKILMDAVQAATFVTEKKTKELVQKMAGLGGGCRADILAGNIVEFNTRKHTNENIYYTVNTLEDAILKGQKVIFKYFDLNECGQRVFRRDGHHYVAEPVALVFREDNYYLISYSEKHEGTANYRVDRMTEVEMIDEPVCDTAKSMRQEVASIAGTAVKMYHGDVTEVTLAFAPSLIGAVYDQFGEETKMYSSSVADNTADITEKTVTATVKVQVSPTFYGWLFQFGSAMRVESPVEVREEYERRLRETLGEGEKMEENKQ